MKKIAIIGAGGSGREVLWLLSDMGLAGQVGGFFESDEVWTGRDVAGLPVRPLSSLDSSRWQAVLAVGSPVVRKHLRDSLPADMTYPTLVHPSVLRSSRIEIGAGTILCAGSIVTCDVSIAEHVQLNIATTVSHDCILHPFVTTGPAVHISGSCVIGEGAYIGSNACLRERTRIAAGATIGMGAVVVSHLEEPATYVGNPARKLARKASL